MQAKLPRFSPPGASQKTMPKIPLLFIISIAKRYFPDKLVYANRIIAQYSRLVNPLLCLLLINPSFWDMGMPLLDSIRTIRIRQKFSPYRIRNPCSSGSVGTVRTSMLSILT